MADNEPKYLAIYHSDHDGEPMALIRTDLPGNHATEMLRAAKMMGGQIQVAGTDSTSMSRSADMADLFATPAPVAALPGSAVPDPDAPGSTADPDAVLRAEIRTQLETDERRKRIEAEVKKEMAETKPSERKAKE